MDVSGFNTKNVTKMNGMFQHCSTLENLEVNGFDISNVETIYRMFCNCWKLKTLDLRAGKEYTELPLNLSESIVLTKVVEDGDDSDVSGTKDGNDNPGAGTEDGADKPTPGTNDGEDKPAPGTEDGDDKPEDEILHDEIIGEFKVSFVRDHVYTGKAIAPKVIVIFGADTLVEGVDYTVS